MDIATQPTSSPRYHVSVNTISGACVWTHEGSEDLCIERLVQDFKEGVIAGVPRARVCPRGSWLERYRLFCGDVELAEGKRFSEYENLPRIAHLTLVKEIDERWTELFAARRRYECDDMQPMVNDMHISNASASWKHSWLGENLTPVQRSKKRAEQISMFNAMLHNEYGGRETVLAVLKAGLA